jgi:hypothetical protein
MAKTAIGLIAIFLTILDYSCKNDKKEIVRIWKISDLSPSETEKRDTTSNVYFDKDNKECNFSDDIINILYKSKEYSIVNIKDKKYYLFKRDEFFKHPLYKSLKVGILTNDNLESMSKVYYVMEHYGVIAVFDKMERTSLDLQKIIFLGDTVNVQKFYPASASQ